MSTPSYNLGDAIEVDYFSNIHEHLFGWFAGYDLDGGAVMELDVKHPGAAQQSGGIRHGKDPKYISKNPKGCIPNYWSILESQIVPTTPKEPTVVRRIPKSNYKSGPKRSKRSIKVGEVFIHLEPVDKKRKK